jgi:hypothetical protein
MKKSELKKYVRENIISELSESTEDEIAKTKELTQAVQDLESAKKEAGIEENGEKDHWADYTDIGMFYLEAHGNMYQGKEQKLTDSQYEKLGKKIVDQLYDGDVSKAYDETYKAVKGNELKYKGSLKEVENIGLADLEEMGYSVGEKALMDIDKEIFNHPNFDSFVSGFMKGFKDNLEASQDYAAHYFNLVNEDAEPTKSDIKKTKGLAKAKEELALLTREMKSLAKKYSKAEGADKEKLVKILKDKTKLKKELESILDNKKI